MRIYQEADLVRVAKRENNKKRDYLVINPLQGKHIAAKPGKTLALFRALADTLKASCEGRNILVIGFAETATAIGAAVAASLGAYYIQTTREEIEGAQYLDFSEEHSHAVQQRLVKNNLDTIMARTDLVIFAEDEVTTGNTILNIIHIMEKEYPGQTEYAAASLLNGMDKEAQAVYESRNIRLYYLLKTDHSGYSEILKQYTKKGDYFSFMQPAPGHVGICKGDSQESEQNRAENSERSQTIDTAKEFSISGWLDARRLVLAEEYENACRFLCREMKKCLQGALSGRILVLGTEEFMYPALLAAECIEQSGAQVWFHATTRSPIAVFKEEQYPLHVRYELPGCYDKNRRTFVYDIASYDAVILMTDAQSREQEGIQALVRAVGLKNKKIYVVRWCLD